MEMVSHDSPILKVFRTVVHPSALPLTLGPAGPPSPLAPSKPLKPCAQNQRHDINTMTSLIPVCPLWMLPTHSVSLDARKSGGSRESTGTLQQEEIVNQALVSPDLCPSSQWGLLTCMPGAPRSPGRPDLPASPYWHTGIWLVYVLGTTKRWLFGIINKPLTSSPFFPGGPAGPRAPMGPCNTKWQSHWSRNSDSGLAWVVKTKAWGYSQKLLAHRALRRDQWNPEDPDGQQSQKINQTTSTLKKHDWELMRGIHTADPGCPSGPRGPIGPCWWRWVKSQYKHWGTRGILI